MTLLGRTLNPRSFLDRVLQLTFKAKLKVWSRMQVQTLIYVALKTSFVHYFNAPDRGHIVIEPSVICLCVPVCVLWIVRHALIILKLAGSYFNQMETKCRSPKVKVSFTMSINRVRSDMHGRIFK